MTDKPFKNAALLIIDLQRGLFSHNTPVYQGGTLVDNICHLAECADQASAPVFYIQHANKSQLVEGTDAFGLHPAMQPLPGDIRITKRHGSAFIDTALESELKARGVSTLVISGLVTHGCVKATCQDALQRGYRVAVVSDGHSSYSPDAVRLIHEWNTRLSDAGAELYPAAAVKFV